MTQRVERQAVREVPAAVRGGLAVGVYAVEREMVWLRKVEHQADARHDSAVRAARKLAITVEKRHGEALREWRRRERGRGQLPLVEGF